ncbi:MAG TPA: hypothetical protein VMV12_08625 [Candidatus Micrarchaeaceae archaeon]|nr:hypothetical protein [Candidatus Micrarchaeaceae archaeon]
MNEVAANIGQPLAPLRLRPSTEVTAGSGWPPHPVDLELVE